MTQAMPSTIGEQPTKPSSELWSTCRQNDTSSARCHLRLDIEGKLDSEPLGVPASSEPKADDSHRITTSEPLRRVFDLQKHETSVEAAA